MRAGRTGWCYKYKSKFQHWFKGGRATCNHKLICPQVLERRPDPDKPTCPLCLVRYRASQRSARSAKLEQPTPGLCPEVHGVIYVDKQLTFRQACISRQQVAAKPTQIDARTARGVYCGDCQLGKQVALGDFLPTNVKIIGDRRGKKKVPG